MSTALENILAQVPELSLTEILTLQENLIGQVRTRTIANGNGNGNGKHNELKAEPNQPRRIRLPHAYRRTAGEIEASLAAMFTPEELSQIGKRDFRRQPPSGKSLSEMLMEDREDRL